VADEVIKSFVILKTICGYRQLGVPKRQLLVAANRETPSKALLLGMGYIIYILEMTSNSSTGVN